MNLMEILYAHLLPCISGPFLVRLAVIRDYFLYISTHDKCFSYPSSSFGITENQEFSGSCNVIATARDTFCFAPRVPLREYGIRFASLKRTNTFTFTFTFLKYLRLGIYFFLIRSFCRFRSGTLHGRSVLHFIDRFPKGCFLDHQ